MPRSALIVPAVTLASELWRYGEDDLWPRALTLSVPELLEIGRLADDLLGKKGIALWPDGPRGSRPVLLAAIEFLEGEARPARRNRGRPRGDLPAELQSSEEERMAAAMDIASEQDRRRPE